MLSQKFTIAAFACITLFSHTLKSQTTNTQGFESSSFPSTWSRGSDNSWAINTPGNAPSAHGGTRVIRFTNGTAGTTSILASPAIDYSYRDSDNCTPTVSFWMYRNSASGSTSAFDYVEVYVNTASDLVTDVPSLLGVINRRTDMTPVVSSAGWYQYSYNIPTSFNSPANYIIFKGVCGNSGTTYSMYIDDVTYTSYESAPSNMSYTSSSCSHLTTSNALSGTNDVQLLQIPIIANGCSSPLKITSFSLNTNGTTSISDIANAKLWYTGTSNTLSYDKEFGSQYISPSGSFNITGSQEISNGTNYFWLTYDLKSTATDGNLLDAELSSFTFSDGTTIVPSTTAPSGSRTISSNTSTYCTPIYSSACTGSTGDYVSNFTLKSGSTTLYANTSDCSSGNYIYTTGANISLTRGFTYTQLITLSYSYDYVRIWIDYNADGSFDESESIGNGNVTADGQTLSGSFTIPACASIGKTRLRVVNRYNSDPTATGACGSYTYGETEDYEVTITEGSTSMVFSSTTTTQALTTEVYPGATNQAIIGIQMVTANCGNALIASSFNLSTSGSSNAGSDISNAKLWYTGTTNSFSTSNLYGEVKASPSGTFTISGNQTLASGTNYFWLTYTINSDAQVGNVVDAECTSVTVGGITQNTILSSPSGSREISILMTSGVFSTCSGKFYDSGGSVGEYGNYENNILTIYPSNPDNNVVITFSSLGLESSTYDKLYFYDGNTTSAPAYSGSPFGGTTNPGTIAACNGYGALTVRFSSDLNNVLSSDPFGWVASISCVAANTNTWTGSTSTDWNSASNWTGGVPTACQNVLIPASTPSCIIATSTTALCKSLTVDNGGVLLINSSGSSTTRNLSIYGNLTNNGTISFAGSQTTTNAFLQLRGINGIISGTGTYTNLPVFFNNLSVYTINGDMAITSLYIDYNATLNLSSSTFTTTRAITQNGKWNLNSALVKHSGDNTSAQVPTISQTRFNSGTSTFYYNATTTAQNVTNATYYNLKINNNADKVVRIGTGGAVTCNNDFSIVEGASVTSGYAYLFNSLYVNGNLSIASNCRLDANDHLSSPSYYPIYLKGNWTNNGTFNSGSNTNSFVEFRGTSSQGIAGTTQTQFYNLTLNNAFAKVELQNTGATVTNVLALGTGTFSLNTGTLTLSRNNTANITRSSGFIMSENTSVSGKISWNLANSIGSYIFPFGDINGSYIPFTLQLTSGNAGYASVATYKTASDNTPYPPTVTNIADNTSNNNQDNIIKRFWQIDQTGTGVANLTFTYAQDEVPTNGEDILVAQRWNSATTNWMPWNSFGSQTSDNAANTVTINSVTQFSPWTLARKLTPLPITLIDFKGGATQNGTSLFWETYSEINNSHFDIERSTDGIDFEKLATVRGHGTSTERRNYNAFDFSPLEGINYYRLKQFDFNGSFTYSNVIAIKYTRSCLSFVYPNPASNLLNISYCSYTEGGAILQIINEQGKKIYGKSLFSEKGVNFDVIDVSNLSSGVYQTLIIGPSGNITTLTFIKN